MQHTKTQFSSVTQSCVTLCDLMDCSTPGLPVHHKASQGQRQHRKLVLTGISFPWVMLPTQSLWKKTVNCPGFEKKSNP